MCHKVTVTASEDPSSGHDCLQQDIVGANALLDEAGILDTDGDGIREYAGLSLQVKFQTSANEVRHQTQELAKQWWAQIGIERENVSYPPEVFFGADLGNPGSLQAYQSDVQMYAQEVYFNADLKDFEDYQYDELVAAGALIPLVHRGNVSARSEDLQNVRINSWVTEFWNIAEWARAE